MLNTIWFIMVSLSLIISMLCGNAEKCALSAIEGAGEGIKLVLSLCGSMCFWSGIMEIAEKSGVINIFSNLLKPITKKLFPKLREGSEAMGAIVMNITANIFGMSNAATPMGLRAMEELQKLNDDKKTASSQMCTFVLINTASVQLIPTTLIALRSTYGSAEPTKIIVPIWITSVTVLLSALFFGAVFKHFSKGKV